MNLYCFMYATFHVNNGMCVEIRASTVTSSLVAAVVAEPTEEEVCIYA
jgi:hypothetical protein